MRGGHAHRARRMASRHVPEGSRPEVRLQRFVGRQEVPPSSKHYLRHRGGHVSREVIKPLMVVTTDDRESGMRYEILEMRREARSSARLDRVVLRRGSIIAGHNRHHRTYSHAQCPASCHIVLSHAGGCRHAQRNGKDSDMCWSHIQNRLLHYYICVIPPTLRATR